MIYYVKVCHENKIYVELSDIFGVIFSHSKQFHNNKGLYESSSEIKYHHLHTYTRI